MRRRDFTKGAACSLEVRASLTHELSEQQIPFRTEDQPIAEGYSIDEHTTTQNTLPLDFELGMGVRPTH
jgi:hypothetical protein